MCRGGQPLSDSPIDCSLDLIYDSLIVSGILQSEIRYSDSPIAAEKNNSLIAVVQ